MAKKKAGRAQAAAGGGGGGGAKRGGLKRLLATVQRRDEREEVAARKRRRLSHGEDGTTTTSSREKKTARRGGGGDPSGRGSGVPPVAPQQAKKAGALRKLSSAADVTAHKGEADVADSRDGSTHATSSEAMPAHGGARTKARRVVLAVDRDDTVLLVGEGNFSFALALLLPPIHHPGSLLIATAYDSEAQCYQKYPDASKHVARIRELAGREDAVLFGIDAGALDSDRRLASAVLARQAHSPSAHAASASSSSSFPRAPEPSTSDLSTFTTTDYAGVAVPPSSSTRRQDPDSATPRHGRATTVANAKPRRQHWTSFSKVVFNFPHVGQGHKDEARNVLANQLLLGRFLCAAAPLLSVGELPRDVVIGARGSGRRQRSGGEEDDEDDRGAREEGESLEGDESAASLDEDAHDSDVLDGARSEGPTEDPQEHRGGPQEGDAQEPNEQDADPAGATTTTTASARQASWRVPARAGSVLVTLRNCKPYVLWDVARLAKRLPSLLPSIAASAPALPRGQSLPPALRSRPSSLALTSASGPSPATPLPKFSLWRSWRFEPGLYRGYEHRRTIGFVEGVSSRDNADLLRQEHRADDADGVGARAATKVRASKAAGGECRTWQFGLVSPTSQGQ